MPDLNPPQGFLSQSLPLQHRGNDWGSLWTPFMLFCNHPWGSCWVIQNCLDSKHIHTSGFSDMVLFLLKSVEKKFHWLQKWQVRLSVYDFCHLPNSSYPGKGNTRERNYSQVFGKTIQKSFSQASPALCINIIN